MALPVIFGISSTFLNKREFQFFSDNQPAGFILFDRNIDDPQQLKDLCATLSELCGLKEKLILIDQEGGRVQRLKKPSWPYMPAAQTYGTLFHLNADIAEKACMLHAKATAEMLKEAGITVNCAPVADIPIAKSDSVIGDRAFSNDVAIIIKLAAISAQSYLQSGILPIAKHVPGHGRALVDSHKNLPIVKTEKEILQDTDFRCFQALNQLPAMMTAHILYTDYDSEYPASLSETIIQRVIREKIGFQGILFSDDICMKALKGSVHENASAALKAGCDIVLHCDGNFEDMQAIVQSVPSSLTPQSLQRIENAFSRIENIQETSQSLQQLYHLLSEFMKS